MCLHTTSFVYISEVKVTLGVTPSAEIRSSAIFVEITWPPEASLSAIFVYILRHEANWPASCLFTSRDCDVRVPKCMAYYSPSLPRSSYVPSSFGLYCSVCFGSLCPSAVHVVAIFLVLFYFFYYILCSRFLVYYIDSFPYLVLLFQASVSKISSVLLLNVVPLFFNTQASLPNFNAALAVMLWIINIVSLFICFPKCLRITPFILLYVCNLSSKSLPYSDMRYPKYIKSVTYSIILSFITIFTLCMWFPHIGIDFVFVLDMVILYFLAIRFKWCAIVRKSSSDVAIKICSSEIRIKHINTTWEPCRIFERQTWRHVKKSRGFKGLQLTHALTLHTHVRIHKHTCALMCFVRAGVCVCVFGHAGSCLPL